MDVERPDVLAQPLAPHEARDVLAHRGRLVDAVRVLDLEQLHPVEVDDEVQARDRVRVRARAGLLAVPDVGPAHPAAAMLLRNQVRAVGPGVDQDPVHVRDPACGERLDHARVLAQRLVALDELVDGHVRLAVGDLVPALDGVAGERDRRLVDTPVVAVPADHDRVPVARAVADRLLGRLAQLDRGEPPAVGDALVAPQDACGLTDLVRAQRIERVSGHPTSLASRSSIVSRRTASRASPSRHTTTGGAARAVVVVLERVAVGARARDHHQVADRGRGQLGPGHEHVAALAVVADQLAGLGGTFPVDDRGREPLAVQHRLEVVAHSAVHRHVRVGAALDGDDLVERHQRAPDHRAAGLDDQPGGGVEVGVERIDGRLRVVGDRRRVLFGRVGDPEAAAEVVDREAAERGNCLGRTAEPLEVEQLRPDVDVQPEQLAAIARRDPVEQRRRRVERDPELRLRAAGVHRRVGDAGHGGVDPQQHGLSRAGEPLDPVDVVGPVDHDHPDPGRERVADVAVVLGVAVQQDVGGVEPGGERDRQLAGGRDVAPESLLGQHPRQRRARQRLRREVHVGGGMSRGERLQVLARRRPQSLLVRHERRRAELGRHVGERHAADGQPPLGVPPGRARQYVEKFARDHARGVSPGTRSAANWTN